MKLPDFNHDDKEWNAWSAFHVDLLKGPPYGVFIQFDTGEFVVCWRRWSPYERRIYNDLHIQIVATDDKDCPPLFTPGMESVVGAKPIPKSHLYHEGQQLLLLDHDHKRAVALDGWLTRDKAPLIPTRFTDSSSRNVSAYYAGVEAVPVGSPIKRHYPQPLTPEQRAHIKELENACKVWKEMQTDLAKRPAAAVLDMTVLRFVNTRFADLTESQRIYVAHKGFNMIVKEEHPWLTFNLDGVTQKTKTKFRVHVIAEDGTILENVAVSTDQDTHHIIRQIERRFEIEEE